MSKVTETGEIHLHPVQHIDGSAQHSSGFSIHPQTVVEYDFELELGLDKVTVLGLSKL